MRAHIVAIDFTACALHGWTISYLQSPAIQNLPFPSNNYYWFEFFLKASIQEDKFMRKKRTSFSMVSPFINKNWKSNSSSTGSSKCRIWGLVPYGLYIGYQSGRSNPASREYNKLVHCLSVFMVADHKNNFMDAKHQLA